MVQLTWSCYELSKQEMVSHTDYNSGWTDSQFINIQIVLDMEEFEDHEPLDQSPDTVAGNSNQPSDGKFDTMRVCSFVLRVKIWLSFKL